MTRPPTDDELLALLKQASRDDIVAALLELTRTAYDRRYLCHALRQRDAQRPASSEAVDG